MSLRVFFLVNLILGILFWVGIAHRLVLLHMLVGILFVASLWAVGVFQAMRGGSLGLTLGTFVLGLIIAIFGLAQESILPGSGHAVVQVIHLLLAVLGIGLGEMSAARYARLAKQAQAI
jgi:hypothetical protein